MDITTLINGRPAVQLAVADRATQYGDGLFTTVRVKNGCLQHWSLHLARLKQGLLRLNIDFSKWRQLQDCAFSLAKEQSEGVLKVLISRGEGGRGYLPAEQGTPNWILTLHPLPGQYQDWREKGIALQKSQISLAKQPLLAGLKHLNRLEQVMIKQEIAAQGWQDALVCDTDKMLVETSVANLFWQTGNQWYTPSLRYAGVKGVMRKCLLDALSRQGVSVIRVRMRAEVLFDASLVCITNSLMGVVPVRSILDHQYDVQHANVVLKDLL
ncbi:aminodeoxychorismate lyase [Bowmanella dokdonensis]|uniref:Aminodeoxychorismate lyase n=1 Tax=Bowmanella dokdonensis TaxID=751969 RepID=A0A939DMD7_9ALTE|nr:aminodeoxychorismate lyase [Bowmanella dokdonensis]MBN7824481.1 aminodeoxychorismate lyase [Bowmanella dokdonensis]